MIEQARQEMHALLTEKMKHSSGLMCSWLPRRVSLAVQELMVFHLPGSPVDRHVANVTF